MSLSETPGVPGAVGAMAPAGPAAMPAQTHLRATPARATLRWLAQALAVLGGLLMCVITLMTCISVAGRNTTGWTLLGDIELTAATCGAAVALFLPLCQMQRRNITIDFFTAWASPGLVGLLERLGALLLGLCMLWLAWRSFQGGLMAWETQAGSMMLGFPEWLTYCGIVPGLALTGVIGLYQVAAGFDTEEAPL